MRAGGAEFSVLGTAGEVVAGLLHAGGSAGGDMVGLATGDHHRFSRAL